MVKRWLTQYDRPGSHLEFLDPPWVWQTRISSRIFLKIQYVHGQKMIDPPMGMTDQDLAYNFF